MNHQRQQRNLQQKVSHCHRSDLPVPDRNGISYSTTQSDKSRRYLHERRTTPLEDSKDGSLNKAGHDSTRCDVSGSSHQPCRNAVASIGAVAETFIIAHPFWPGPLEISSSATLCQRKGKSGWLCCWWKVRFIVAPAHCLSMCLQCCPAPVRCRNNRHRADVPCVVGLAHPIETGAGTHAGTPHECACTRKPGKTNTRRPCIGSVSLRPALRE